VLRPCVVRIRRERWLTPDGRTVVAPLPAGIVGHFGPELRRFALFQYHQGQVTVPRLVAQLGAVGIAISKRPVVRLLNEGQGIFLDEARDVLRAGLATAPLPAPSRRQSAARTGSAAPRSMDQRRRHRRPASAPQRVLHPARQLDTFTDRQHTAQQVVRALIWWFYADLKAYRREPNRRRRHELRARFDRIFRRRTGFAKLDRLLARLHANKEELLLVLDRPEVALHTNGSERDLRPQVVKRKISGGTRSRTTAAIAATPSSVRCRPAPSSACCSGTISATASASPEPKRRTCPISSGSAQPPPECPGFCPSYPVDHISHCRG